MSGFIGDLTGANAAKKASREAQIAQSNETQRENNIKAGAANVDAVFNGSFTPAFYDATKQNYLAYAQPQLDQQYQDAQKQLTFSLDRSGMLNSSARSQEQGKLQQQYDTNSQGIAQAADQSANLLRNNVEGARSSLIAGLGASGDVSGTVAQALQQANVLSATPQYSALGQLFGDTTSALAQQAQLDKQNALLGGTAIRSPYSLGLNAASGAVKTY